MKVLNTQEMQTVAGGAILPMKELTAAIAQAKANGCAISREDKVGSGKYPYVSFQGSHYGVAEVVSKCVKFTQHGCYEAATLSCEYLTATKNELDAIMGSTGAELVKA